MESNTRVVHKLTLAKQHALNNLVMEHYTSQGMTDPQFAKYASDKLCFVVTAGNVQGVRQAFDIPSTRDKLRQEDTDLTRRIQNLEKSVAFLAMQLGYDLP